MFTRATPAGVASDKRSVWSLWSTESSWYIVTWIIASSKVEVVELTEFGGPQFWCLILSPDGEYIAADWNHDRRCHFAILDGKTGRKLASSSWESASLYCRDPITAVQFSLDSRLLAVVHLGEKLQLLHRR
ncbi:hypothetical protein L207DRAFT_522471 [Hyaloscypha variabilis F]|uniref:Anaphase-promoting complex subunit 4 WD40 domain-containing protein n=1 Tax=Hyaloscypha variabilis (strain UAMH 11265 / GT02V1 / F) TaxID=1149755 RepID=A0A2J6S8B4_HYAVF|nr:hypothetical protein L207DRAFT_522471 [Hyaloscypha variabilis F]